MSARLAAAAGNGRLIARISRDGSVIGLRAPHLDQELVNRPIHVVVAAPSGRRRLGGRGWKHHLEYVRGTNVLRCCRVTPAGPGSSGGSPRLMRACAWRSAPKARRRSTGSEE